jgi:translocation and assembly module TamB
MSKKGKVLLVIAGVVVVLAIVGMSIDYGTGLVRDMVSKTVQENLDSQVTKGSVSGNPIKGYTLSDIAIATDGEEVLSAERITAKVSILAFLTGGAPVSMVEIEGFKSDVDKINRLIPKIKPGEGEGELPLQKVRITDSTFGSQWATLQIRNVLLAFSDDVIKTDLDLVVDDLPVKGELDVSMDKEALAVRKMDIKIGDGSLSGSGGILPELSMEVKAANLNIPQLIDFWPKADPALYKGTVSTEFTVKGSWQDPDISGNVDYLGQFLAGIPIERAVARWRYHSYRLDVAGLDMRLFGFPLAGSLAFVFDPAAPPRMLVDLKGAAADLEALAKVSKKLEGLSGTLDKFSVHLEGDVQKPQGQISFAAGKLGYKGYAVTDTSIDARIKDGNIAITGKSVFEGAPLAFGGNVSNFMTKPAANISGTLRSLSLGKMGTLVPAIKEMKASGNVNSDYKLTGGFPDLVVAGKVWSDKLSAMDYTLTNVSTFFDYNMKADTLSFSDLKAGFNQAALSGKGKISSLATDKRSGDIQIQAGNLDSAFFAAFYPPISEYKLKGRMTVEAHVRGALANPAMTVSLSSPSLSVMDSVGFTNLRAGTEIAGITAGIPAELDLEIAADAASVAGVVLQSPKVGINKKDKVIAIKEGKAVMGGGNLSASGTVTMAEPTEKTSLDIAVKASNVNLEKITQKGGKPLPASGIVTSDAKVSGTLENPKIAVEASAPFVAAAGMTVDNVKARIAGNMEKLSIEELSGKVGEGSITVTGNLKPVPFAADLAVNGQNLDIKQLTSRFEKLKPFNITGVMDLVFNGHFEKGKNSGNGKATSPSVRFMGINFTNIVLPVELVDDKLVSSNGTASLYGGKVKNKGSLNLANLSFNDEAEISGTDVDALMKDAFALKGNITAKADLTARVSGSFGADGIKYSGKGLLKTGQGSVTGFKIVDLITAVHGVKGLRFASAFAPFNLETGRLILNKDTLIKAPEGDPLYRHFSANGTVGPEDNLNLNCSGKVNVKVVNAVLGGAAGGAAGLTMTQGIAGILEGALKGSQAGMQEDDFRDISFTLKGTFDKPGISNLKVSAPEKQVTTTQPAEQELTPTEKLKEQLPVKQETAPTQEKPQEENIEEKIKQEIFKKIFE